MKKILVLSDKNSIELNQFDAEKFSSMINALGEVEVKISMFTDLIYVIKDGDIRVFDQHTGYDISDFDIVYRKRSEFLPHHAIACSLYVRSKGGVFLDSEFSGQMNANAHKLVEHMVYALNKLPFPATIVINKHNVTKVFENNSLDLTFPMVLKSLTGTRGDENYLVHSAEETMQILENASSEHPEFALQPFIKNDSDYRILVLGYETSLIIKRMRKSTSTSHTNNTSKGADAFLVDTKDLEPSVIELANNAARVFKREVAGVDIMFGLEDGLPYILEVNRSPQIEQGAFVPEKIKKISEFFKKYSAS